jgi:hypothetical protein
MNRVYCATSGEVVEWPKALVLKTRDGKLSVGSNPTLSANNAIQAIRINRVGLKEGIYTTIYTTNCFRTSIT